MSDLPPKMFDMDRENFEFATRDARKLFRDVVLPWARDARCGNCNICGKVASGLRRSRGRYSISIPCKYFLGEVDVLVTASGSTVVIFSCWGFDAAMRLNYEEEMHVQFERVREWLRDRIMVAKQRHTASEN